MHKGARTDPCGGRGVTRVPTATCALFRSRVELTQNPGAIAPRECGCSSSRLFDMWNQHVYLARLARDVEER